MKCWHEFYWLASEMDHGLQVSLEPMTSARLPEVIDGRQCQPEHPHERGADWASGAAGPITWFQRLSLAR